jgi:hypothetical protein
MPITATPGCAASFCCARTWCWLHVSSIDPHTPVDPHTLRVSLTGNGCCRLLLLCTATHPCRSGRAAGPAAGPCGHGGSHRWPVGCSDRSGTPGAHSTTQ